MAEQNKSVTLEEENIELKDLKPGDILIFDGEEGSLISNLIMLFTHSSVTHGALFVQNGNEAALADSGECGIKMHLVQSNPDARGVHVRRLTKEGGFGDDYDKIVAPVVEIARDYARQGLPYPYSDLVLLAMILIYKDVSHVNLKQAVVIKLLQVVAAELKTLIDEKFHDGKHTMVCSSFVYQCFLDASKDNPDLKLNIENGDAQATLKAKRSATLFDLYAEHAAEYNYNTKRFADAKGKPVTESIEEILNNLVDKENKDHISLIKSNALSNAIEEFLKVLLKAAGVAVDSIEELIENAKKQQALFVTPNDLYCHTTNTEIIGKVPLDRISDEYNPQ